MKKREAEAVRSRGKFPRTTFPDLPAMRDDGRWKATLPGRPLISIHPESFHA